MLNFIVYSGRRSALFYRHTSRLRMQLFSAANIQAEPTKNSTYNIETRTVTVDEIFETTTVHKAYSNSELSTIPKLSWDAATIFESLRGWRKQRAKELGIPAPAIFNNKVFYDIIQSKVTNLVELSNIPGMHDIKLKKYGDDILQVVLKFDPSTASVTSLNTETSSSSSSNSLLNTSPIQIASITEPVINAVASPSIAINTTSPITLSPAAPATELLEELSQEQRVVVEAILCGTNVFITGAAGTGKSKVLRTAVTLLKEKLGEDAVAVTAPTGIAAVNIGGQTIHSFAGLVMAKQKDGSSKLKSFRSAALKERWLKTHVIIIDEVSVLSPEIFEMLEHVGQLSKRNNKVFGGIQLVVFGDFLQLPPIIEDKYAANVHRYCFESLLWKKAGLTREDGGIYELKEIIRQKDDPVYRNILQEVRVGNLSSESISTLNNCVLSIKPVPNDGILPTKLYCTNKDVDQENSVALASLPGPEVILNAIDCWPGNKPPPASQKTPMLLLMDKRVPSQLHLKVGAQVVLLRNKAGSGGKTSLCNGSRGVIIGFRNVSGSTGSIQEPLVRFDNGQEVYIGVCDWNLSGQDKESISYSDTSSSNSSSISGEEMTKKTANGFIRKQIPLKLAWALTIHKSQGLTLTRASVALGGAFDYGQAYTALSRVTSMSGLWLTTPVSPQSIITSEAVLKFYGYK